MKPKKQTRILTRGSGKRWLPEPLLGCGVQSPAWRLPSMSGESYRCGFCGSEVAPSQGMYADGVEQGKTAKICICHLCSRPTFFDVDGRQYPEEPFGNAVKVLDKSVRSIYEEARQAISAGAYTATVLCCRKLLMHIAVERGALIGKNFVFYVEFLSDNNHVPPTCKAWIDQIRQLGNEANHQIIISTREDAEQLLQFNEMLLKILYEYPVRAAARSGNTK